MARTPPPQVPRGVVTPEALGLWFTRFDVWAKEQASRVLALENAPAAVAAAAADGAALHSFMHAGGSGWSSWRLAGSYSNQGASGIALTANQLRAVPFVAPRAPATLTDIGFEVTTGLAGNARCGIYTNTADNNLYPNALVVDGGSLSTAVAAVKSTTGLAIALTPGQLYWHSHVQSAAASIRCLTAPSDVLGHSNDALGNIWMQLRVAFAFAALPATFPAFALPDTNTATTTTAVPALYWKVS